MSRDSLRSPKMQRVPDIIVISGLLFLLVASPLAFGAVHSIACITLETALFVLAGIWMVRLAMDASAPSRGGIAGSDLVRLLIPAGFLVAFGLMQLVPMPPALMRAVSPSTYQLYQVAFPGWPSRSPGRVFFSLASAQAQAEAEAGTPLPPVGNMIKVPEKSAREVARFRSEMPAGLAGLRWRTLSISPQATWRVLVHAAACGSVFFLVLAYPMGLSGEAEAEQRFRRMIIGAMLAAGALVAMIGIAEHVWWNGKLLWFYVPEDWGQPLFGILRRASGPFVNADHFANYLAMLFPLCILGSLFPMPIVSRPYRGYLKTVFGVLSFLIGIGIMLSLSRGGWAAAGAGTIIALALSLSYARSEGPALLAKTKIGALPLALACFGIILLLVLYMLGSNGREDVADRLANTIDPGEVSIPRLRVWRESVNLFEDYPLFGVGLGAWPEIFPRVEAPPHSKFYFREAENDYLQFATETGIVGIALLGWLLYEIFRRLCFIERLGRRQWPLYAGLVGGIAAGLIHEAFDFGLRIPSNALLFAVMLALAMRVGVMPDPRRRRFVMRTVPPHPQRTYMIAACVGGLAVAMVIGVFAQDCGVYPYKIFSTRNLGAAASRVIEHPAVSETHSKLAQLIPASAPEGLRLNELRAAVWFDPNDPRARDLLAQRLFLEGRKQAGLDQITESVARAPQIDEHRYLQSAALTWLLPDEQAAIAAGFERAATHGRGVAAWQVLASFYSQLGRYTDAAKAGLRAAALSAEPLERTKILMDVGRNYAAAGNYRDADAVFKRAIAIDPSNPEPYAQLAHYVYVPQGQSRDALVLADRIVRAGGDPFRANAAIADAIQDDDRADAIIALERALKYRDSFSRLMQLGYLYAGEQRFDRASIAYRNAIDLRPSSAAAFSALAQSEEASYDYSAADKDYKRAARLAPSSNGIQNQYRDFLHRTAESISTK
jgi:tetratricopeptide (TPR) repeat protein